MALQMSLVELNVIVEWPGWDNSEAVGLGSLNRIVKKFDVMNLNKMMLYMKEEFNCK